MQQVSNRLRRFSFFVLWVFGLMSVVTPTVNAGMISAERYQTFASQTPAADRATLATFLSRDDVRDQLIALGVDPAQAEQRVAALSDAELAQAARLVDQPAGAGVVGAIVLIFLVLLITDILGLTDVFTFVKKR